MSANWINPTPAHTVLGLDAFAHIEQVTMPPMSDQTLAASNTCSGRISIDHVGQVVAKLQAMDLARKEHLAGELAKEQPAFFASFLAQHKAGVSYEKMEFLLGILFVCYLAMKQSGLQWAVVTDGDIKVCMARYVESVQFGKDLDPQQQHELVLQFIATHPEQALLAYVQVETANWLRRVHPEDSDRFVMLAAANMVNCIGYAQSTDHDSHPSSEVSPNSIGANKHWTRG